MCAGKRRNQPPVKLSRDFTLRRGGSRSGEMELVVLTATLGFNCDFNTSLAKPDHTSCLYLIVLWIL